MTVAIEPFSWRVFFAMFLAACNLRPAITSLAAVLDHVRVDLQLSATMTGLLVMSPVLCFGVFTVLAPPLLRRLGADRVVLLGLVALSGGLALRSLLGVFGMFAGTLLAGASISIALVALPSIIKREYGARAGSIMGVYSMALGLGASVAAGLTVPLQELPYSNWQWALAFWLLPAAAAALLWLRPRALRTGRQANIAAGAGEDASAVHLPSPNMLRSPLAWMVTLYMGLQSCLSYCAITWLPAMLAGRGMTQMQAGFGLSVCMGAQLTASLVSPWLGRLGKDQRLPTTLMLGMSWAGLMGVLYAPFSWLWFCVVITGLGMGVTFSLSLMLLVLRVPNPSAAAALAGMSQGVGYCIAALGPFAVGALYAVSQQWHTSAILMSAVAVLAWVCGMYAGRDRLIA